MQSNPAHFYREPESRSPECRRFPTGRESGSRPLGTRFPAVGNTIPSRWEQDSQPGGNTAPGQAGVKAECGGRGLYLRMFHIGVSPPPMSTSMLAPFFFSMTSHARSWMNCAGERFSSVM